MRIPGGRDTVGGEDVRDRPARVRIRYRLFFTVGQTPLMLRHITSSLGEAGPSLNGLQPNPSHVSTDFFRWGGRPGALATGRETIPSRSPATIFLYFSNMLER